MGGMVTGLEIHTRATAIGRFTRQSRAAPAAMGIWPNVGRKAMKRPTKKAPETEWRLRWNRLGSCSRWPKKFREGLFLNSAGSGNQRLKIFFAIQLSSALLRGATLCTEKGTNSRHSCLPGIPCISHYLIENQTVTSCLLCLNRHNNNY